MDIEHCIPMSKALLLFKIIFEIGVNPSDLIRVLGSSPLFFLMTKLHQRTGLSQVADVGKPDAACAQACAELCTHGWPNF